MRLVLASVSPRRAELLSRLNIPFEIQGADCDEECKGATAGRVLELARRKAAHVARAQTGSFLVLGADTLVEIDGHIFGKPADIEQQSDMLALLSGSWNSVYTGVALYGPQGERESFVACTKVHFTHIPPEDVQAYMRTDEGRDKAGAYAVQGWAGAYIDRIDGDYTNAMGLPLCQVREVIARHGCRPLHTREGAMGAEGERAWR